jgi:hypothetical protein
MIPALAMAALCPSVVQATTAVSLSDFDGVEEPAVIYHPSTNTFTNDSYVNITSPSSGDFKFYLRYTSGSSGSWDGDRTTTSTDRQRAEVRALGTHQLPGETYDYQSTWRTDSAMVVGSHFCHITQVKADDGDNGPPLVTISLVGNSTAQLAKCSGSDSGLSSVRQFSWTPATWITTKIRLKAANDTTGALQLSVNGDTLQGLTNVSMYRPNATKYHPKWGLYRGVDTSQPFGNNYLEHQNLSSNKVVAQNYSFEAESLSVTSSGAATAPQTDTNSSGGKWIALEATGTGQYMEFTTPSINAGSYSLAMEWKGNNNRGQLKLTVDGVQVGGTLDQYAAGQTYPTTTFGTATIGTTGTHKIRLTVTGKNSSSSGYWLSADKFTLTAK